MQCKLCLPKMIRHAGSPAVEPNSNQLFVTLMVADPEPQKSACPSGRQCTVVQRARADHHFLTVGFFDFLEL